MGDEIEITRKESSPKHCKCGRVKFNLVMCSRCYDKIVHPQKVLEIKKWLYDNGIRKTGNNWREPCEKWMKDKGLWSIVPRSVKNG
jgi:hypothetical protein